MMKLGEDSEETCDWVLPGDWELLVPCPGDGS